MSEQQSKKRGVRSEAQKETAARDPYEPIPPSKSVGGAFGQHKADTPTDEDLSLRLNEKRTRDAGARRDKTDSEPQD